MATTIKYDNTDVETTGGGEHAQPGTYAAKIASVTHRTTKTNGQPANDLEVVVDVGEEYRRIWTYIGLDVKWKMREFTDAVGLPPKGELTAAKLKALAGTKVDAKLIADTDLDGEYRARVKNLFKAGTGGVNKTSNGSSASSGDHEDGYDDLSVDDLKAELEERGIDIPKGRITEARLIALLVEDDEAAGEEPEPEEEAAEDGYDEWELQDLKDEIEERGATGNLPGGRMTKQKLIDFLRELDAGGSEEEDTDTPEEDGYDEWDDDDLKAEIAERNEQGAEIKVTGRSTKQKMIDALRADDASAEPF